MIYNGNWYLYIALSKFLQCEIYIWFKKYSFSECKLFLMRLYEMNDPSHRMGVEGLTLVRQGVVLTLIFCLIISNRYLIFDLRFWPFRQIIILFCCFDIAYVLL